MTVWLVERCEPYEGCEVMGVFSTEQLARAHADAQELVWADIEVTAWVVDVTTSG